MAPPPGPIRTALLQAAARGPAPVLQLAARACVGRAAARYTASRMLLAGELAVVHAGRPAIVGLPQMVPAAPLDEPWRDVERFFRHAASAKGGG